MHERGERTRETAPDPAGVLEIKTHADDATEENIDEPFVVGLGDQLSGAIFSLEQQMESGSRE